jgi:hypothetical protein
MIGRRELRLAGAAVAFILAAALALLAVDVWRTADALEEGDVRFDAAASENEVWTAPRRIPFDLAPRLLGVDDDLEFREAVRLFLLSRPGGSFTSRPQQLRSRGEAETALSRIEQRASDPERASEAANLLGVLAWADAILDQTRAPTAPARALAEFQNAVVLDPSNAAARTNLELVLHLLRADVLREGPGGTGEFGGAPGGASLSAPGTGY